MDGLRPQTRETAMDRKLRAVKNIALVAGLAVASSAAGAPLALILKAAAMRRRAGPARARAREAGARARRRSQDMTPAITPERPSRRRLSSAWAVRRIRISRSAHHPGNRSRDQTMAGTTPFEVKVKVAMSQPIDGHMDVHIPVIKLKQKER